MSVPDTADNDVEYTPGHESALKHWFDGKQAYCVPCSRPLDPKGVFTENEFVVITFRCPYCDADYDWRINADTGGLGAGSFQTDSDLAIENDWARPVTLSSANDILFSLEVGDEILINKRKKPMTVVDVNDKLDDDLLTSYTIWVEGPRGGVLVIRVRKTSEGVWSREIRRKNKSSKTGWQYHSDLKYIVRMEALNTPNDFIPIDIDSVTFRDD